MAEVDVVQGQIAAGASLSAQVDIGTKSLVGLVLPSNWSAAAGGISFQASVDGGTTWGELTTIAGTPYSIGFTAAGAAYLAIDPAILRGISSFKIRSGTAASPNAQTNLVTLTLVTRLKF